MLKKALVIVVVLLSIPLYLWGEDFSHDIFTALLKDHVRNGLVDYSALQGDLRLTEYLQMLTRFDPENLSGDQAKMAFYINAYNAYTIKVIVDNYPLDSITDLNDGGLTASTALKKTVWDKDLVTINRKKMTLNEIEHEILRKEFDDFRIHFALVCAALSCPPLRSEAYTGERLDSQLDEQGRIFFRDAGLNSFDVKKREARLTKILEWFGEDFGKNDKARLLAIASFLEMNIGNDIRSNTRKWKITFNEYDWSLNDLN